MPSPHGCRRGCNASHRTQRLRAHKASTHSNGERETHSSPPGVPGWWERTKGSPGAAVGLPRSRHSPTASGISRSTAGQLSCGVDNGTEGSLRPSRPLGSAGPQPAGRATGSRPTAPLCLQQREEWCRWESVGPKQVKAHRGRCSVAEGRGEYPLAAMTHTHTGALSTEAFLPAFDKAFLGSPPIIPWGKG